MLPDNESSVGTKGTVLRGDKKSIKGDIIKFDGRKAHGTMPFKGTRYAVILYSIGTAAYDRTPSLMQSLCAQIGFPLPRPCITQPSASDDGIARLAFLGEDILPTDFDTWPQIPGADGQDGDEVNREEPLADMTLQPVYLEQQRSPLRACQIRDVTASLSSISCSRGG